jgi:hypothetical protein
VQFVKANGENMLASLLIAVSVEITLMIGTATACTLPF